MELMHGLNFKEILFRDDLDLLVKAYKALCSGIQHIWGTTMNEGKSPISFISQLQKRIGDVYSVHSSFFNSYKIGGIYVPDFINKLEALSYLDEKLFAPFSVLTHGDLNIDNIIYEDLSDRIHFVDIYRSTRGDYVQDISVFLVSNFRLPVFEREFRDRINFVISNFFVFAKNFAKAHDDSTFLKRLALGLARSFITSTRFELNNSFSREMYNRGVYLIDRIISFDGDDSQFTFKDSIIKY